jgi:hypothetical protein
MNEVEILSIEFDGQSGLNEGAVVAIERTCTDNWCPIQMTYSKPDSGSAISILTRIGAKVIDYENGIEEDSQGYSQPTYNLHARLLEDNNGNRYVHVVDNGDYCYIGRTDRISLAAELATFDADDKEYFRSEHLI